MRRCRPLIPMALACSLTIAAAILPSVARAELADEVEPMDPETRGLAIIADLLLARPLGLVATVAGSTIFLAGLPFAAASGDFAEPARLLIEEPAYFTFTRPLGQIDSLR